MAPACRQRPFTSVRMNNVAERVLLPGDPGRALRLAQQLIAGTPKMLNHNRGLWGYAGTSLTTESR